jgi:hypothetical protein
MVKVARTVEGDFNEVSLSSGFSVFIYHSGKDSILIEAESNLIPEIITEVNDNCLELRASGFTCLNPVKPIIIRVYTNDVQSLNVSGSGSIQTDTLHTDNLKIQLSGSGSMRVPVTVKNIQVSLSGSGNISLSGNSSYSTFNLSGSGAVESYEMLQKSCNLTISGSGNCFVNIVETLDANISGSGSVFYKGRPEINSRVTGSGRVVSQLSRLGNFLQVGSGFNSFYGKSIYLIY